MVEGAAGKEQDSLDYEELAVAEFSDPEETAVGGPSSIPFIREGQVSKSNKEPAESMSATSGHGLLNQDTAQNEKRMAEDFARFNTAPKPPPAPKERAIAFSRPEQMCQILREAQNSRLQLLLKTVDSTKNVRAQVETASLSEKLMRLGGISQAGDELLRGHEFVKVEFILLSKKLVFVSQVRGRAAGKIFLAFPDKIVAIERRLNARFSVSASEGAAVEFPDRTVDLERFDAPFVPSFMLDSKSRPARLRIDDVSLGGVACFTRYSACAELFRANEHFVAANLLLPGVSPISVPVSVRWIKKTSAALQPGRFETALKILQTRYRSFLSEEDMVAKETYYRLGLQFHEVSAELDAALRQFIRKAQSAGSV